MGKKIVVDIIRWYLFICKYIADKKSKGKWKNLKQFHLKSSRLLSGLAGKLVDTDHPESPTDSFIWPDFLIKTVADSLVSANTMEEKEWGGEASSEELEVNPAADFLQSPKLDVQPLVPHDWLFYYIKSKCTKDDFTEKFLC